MIRRLVLLSLLFSTNAFATNQSAAKTAEEVVFRALSEKKTGAQMVSQFKKEEQGLVTAWLKKYGLLGKLPTTTMKKNNLAIGGKSMRILPSLEGAMVITEQQSLPVLFGMDLKDQLDLWDRLVRTTTTAANTSRAPGILDFVLPRSMANENSAEGSGLLGAFTAMQERREIQRLSQPTVVAVLPTARAILQNSLYSLNCHGERGVRDFTATIGYPVNTQSDLPEIDRCLSGLQSSSSDQDRIACLYRGAEVSRGGDRSLLTQWISVSVGQGQRAARGVDVHLVTPPTTDSGPRPLRVDRVVPAENRARIASGSGATSQQDQIRTAIGELLMRACGANDPGFHRELQGHVQRNQARYSASASFTNGLFRSPPSQGQPLPQSQQTTN